MGDRVIHVKALLWFWVCCTYPVVMLPGCFVEKSYPLRRREATRLHPPQQAQISARKWLSHTHEKLEHLLPAGARRAMLTEDLTNAEGRAVSTYDHFELRFDDMDTLLGNFNGLLHTAQLVSTELHLDELPQWPGFEDVWIPVGGELELAGRLGFARDGSGTARRADCVVILPGLYGDNGVMRTRDLAGALRERGFHVLALVQVQFQRLAAHRTAGFN